MSGTEVRVIDAYVFIKTKSGLKYLLLKRAEEKIYGGLWQCVTGKIEADEPAWKTAVRELKEETSIINVEFLCEFPEWINYDIPLPLADRLWSGKYRGQSQRWLLFYFSGEDNEININTLNPEFRNWIWLNPLKLPEKAISFKKDVYMKINEVFIPMLENYISANIK